MKSKKEAENGWGFAFQKFNYPAESRILPTALALSVLSQYLSNTDSAINQERSWLGTKQNSDGGFGEEGSTIYETAYSLLALLNTGSEVTEDAIIEGIDYLKGLQDSNGSWNNDEFSTAVALRVLFSSPLDCPIMEADPVGATLFLEKDGADLVFDWDEVADAYGYYIYRWNPRTKELVVPPDVELYNAGTNYRQIGALLDTSTIYYKIFALECRITPTPSPTPTWTATYPPTFTPTITATGTNTPTATPTPTPTPIVPALRIDRPLDSGDLNGDGFEDFIGLRDKQLVIFIYTEAGFLEIGHPLGNHVYSAFIKDFNGDETLDIVLGEQSGFRIFLNNGAAQMIEDLFVSTQHAVRDVKAADVDGDGDNDLVVTGGSLVVFLNELQTTGQFVLSQILPCFTNVQSLLAADVNSDMDTDIVAGGKCFFGHGDGTFEDSGQKLGMKQAVKVLGGDIDQDGDTDLVVIDLGCQTSHSRACVVLLMNDGQGTFHGFTTIPLAEKPETGIVGDWDNDGDLDLYIGTSQGDENVFLMNDGSGNFTRLNNENARFENTFGVSGCVTFDLGAGDGDLDIISGSEKAGSYVYLNTAASFHVNSRPQPPANFQSYSAGNDLVLTWGAGFDDESSSLHYFLRVGTSPGGDDIVETEVGPSAAVKTSFGNAWYAHQKVLKGVLSASKSIGYYWSVASVDHNLSRSQWSAEQVTVFPFGKGVQEGNTDSISGQTNKRDNRLHRQKEIPAAYYLRPFIVDKVVATSLQ